MFQKLLRTTAPAATWLIRLMVAVVFASEGIQKFLFTEQLGVGRFTRIGIAFPDITAPLVGMVEIVCGSLILLGLGTRLAAIPLLIDISVAIVSTKVPILLGRGFWGFQLTKLESYGWWSMLHEARTDLSMWLALVYLLDRRGRGVIVGYAVDVSTSHAIRTKALARYTLPTRSAQARSTYWWQHAR